MRAQPIDELFSQGLHAFACGLEHPRAHALSHDRRRVSLEQLALDVRRAHHAERGIVQAVRVLRRLALLRDAEVDGAVEVALEVHVVVAGRAFRSVQCGLGNLSALRAQDPQDLILSGERIRSGRLSCGEVVHVGQLPVPTVDAQLGGVRIMCANGLQKVLLAVFDGVHRAVDDVSQRVVPLPQARGLLRRAPGALARIELVQQLESLLWDAQPPAQLPHPRQHRLALALRRLVGQLAPSVLQQLALDGQVRLIDREVRVVAEPVPQPPERLLRAGFPRIR
mmetsp:Transcript_58467/g.169633  ORF Transcript_58467/g.169633 Transcript_58467/m.169633 type:complete len:281 (-) Transcript_58467:564-1406(-)